MNGMKRRKIALLLSLLLAATLLLGASPLYARTPASAPRAGTGTGGTPVAVAQSSAQSPSRTADSKRVTAADRAAAAASAQAAGLRTGEAVKASAVPTPGGVPDYFGPYPNYANSPLPKAVTAVPYPTFYFAEGTTRPNFETYFTLQNPGTTAANVRLTYMKGDGTTATTRLTIPKNTRSTVNPVTTLGRADDAAHDFSTKVECLNHVQIVAERPMYFNYNGVWTGGSDAMGATSTASTFYFAEGTVRPNFETYFTIENPGTKTANVTLTYMKGNGTTQTQGMSITAHTRSTVHPADVLGVGNDAAHDFSTRVQCTNGQRIVAERPMYFQFLPNGMGAGMWKGGHNSIGTEYAAYKWEFAEGCTRSGFRTYLCVSNPNSRAAQARIEYFITRADGGREDKAQTLELAANSRKTVLVNDSVGEERDVSATVTCNTLIVVERPMYFSYDLYTDGGVSLGLPVAP